MFPITIAFGTLIIGLITLLAINTTRMRMKTPRDPSPTQREQLRRAMRAHGNNFEHGVPVILLMMFYELGGASATVLCSIGSLYLLARVVYCFGVFTRPGNLAQQLGAGVTYLIELALLGLLLLTLFWG